MDPESRTALRTMAAFIANEASDAEVDELLRNLTPSELVHPGVGMMATALAAALLGFDDRLTEASTPADLIDEPVGRADPPQYEQAPTTPALLSHYTSSEVFLSYIAPEQRLRLTPLAFMNDPTESYQWEFYIGLQGNIHTGMPDTSRHEEKFRKLSKGYIQNHVKIGCFCEPTEREDSWLKPRMWAMYGDRNRGINLIFDKDALIQKVSAISPARRSWCNRVEYIQTANPYDIVEHRNRSLLANELIHRDAKEVLLSLIDEKWKTYFFQKHKDWRDENEFRIAILDEHNDFTYLPISSELLFVVLGPAIDRCLIPRIIEARGKFAVPPEVYLIDQASNGHRFLVPAAFYSKEPIHKDLILPGENQAMYEIMRSFT